MSVKRKERKRNMAEIKISDKWVLRLVEKMQDIDYIMMSVHHNKLRNNINFELWNIETGKVIEISNEASEIMLGEILGEVFYRRDAIVKLLKCLVDISGGYNIRINDKLFIIDGDVVVTIKTDMGDRLLNTRNDYECAAYLVKLEYAYDPIIIAGEILKELMNQLFMSYIKEHAINRCDARGNISIQIVMLNEKDLFGAVDALDNLRMDFNDFGDECQFEGGNTFEEVMKVIKGDTGYTEDTGMVPCNGNCCLCGEELEDSDPFGVLADFDECGMLEEDDEEEFEIDLFDEAPWGSTEEGFEEGDEEEFEIDPFDEGFEESTEESITENFDSIDFDFEDLFEESDGFTEVDEIPSTDECEYGEELGMEMGVPIEECSDFGEFADSPFAEEGLFEEGNLFRDSRPFEKGDFFTGNE